MHMATELQIRKKVLEEEEEEQQKKNEPQAV
jgi:hypothetical protein